MSTQLPRPKWVDEIIVELRRVPDAVRLARSVGAEQQKAHQIRESRKLVLEELNQAQRKIAALELKIAELEQTLINYLRSK
jgi:hypothetical protein